MIVLQHVIEHSGTGDFILLNKIPESTNDINFDYLLWLLFIDL